MTGVYTGIPNPMSAHSRTWLLLDLSLLPASSARAASAFEALDVYVLPLPSLSSYFFVIFPHAHHIATIPYTADRARMTTPAGGKMMIHQEDCQHAGSSACIDSMSSKATCRITWHA